MNRAKVDDQRMRDRLSGLYTEAVVVDSITKAARNAKGEKVKTGNTAVLTNIPARLGPAAEKEREGPEVVREFVPTHVLEFPMPYLQITASMLCQIDGSTYDVLEVQHDSAGLRTRLMLRLVKP